MTVLVTERARVARARKEDAAALARLIMIAGEGLPLLIWEGMRQPGESAMDVGARRAARQLTAMEEKQGLIGAYKRDGSRVSSTNVRSTKQVRA